ncbi:MAG: ABC transporter ATP-binding protein, partial [Coriobacteriaceae bacterium]|nr:ABC transporter ATP-binding protein [Coriobacteriaceae bacterium]
VEDLLDSWPGTLILVTHDRFLMERVTDQQWALLGGKLRHVPGGVDEYLRLAAQASPGGAARPQAPGFTGTVEEGGDALRSAEKAAGSEPSLSNAERQRLKKEVASLERKMETRRTKLEEAKEAMFAIDPTDFAALTAQQDAISAAQEELDELEMAWLEVSEQLEG